MQNQFTFRQFFKYVSYVLVLVVVAFMLWRFSFLLVWILFAAILSFIGHPLVRFFSTIHFKKMRLPHSMSALFALLTIVLVFVGLVAIFVPLIVQQATTISKIDTGLLAQNFQGPLLWLGDNLHELGVIPPKQSIHEFIVLKAKSVVNAGSVSNILNGIFSAAGSFFVGMFSVLFIAFFFMKDENMFEDTILLFVPEKKHHASRKVIADSKNLLMRYFIGVLLEVLCVMSIIAVGLWIFGVENALLIGFFGGMMNIIPYLGPLIGAIIALTLGITSTLAAGAYNELISVLAKLGGVLLIANFIDNNILVPMIYSKSVKAHPLEIFFVIIIGGSLAGLLGMLLAIPVYTVLRVIAREFLQQFKVVQKLTAKIS